MTFYHQYQREKQYDKETGEEYIETTLEDIEEANKLMKEILFRKSDTLTIACRNYLEQLKDYLKEAKQSNYTNREIIQAFRVKEPTLRRYHQQLNEVGLLSRNKSKGQKYYLNELAAPEDYQELRKKVDTVLDQILEKLKSS